MYTWGYIKDVSLAKLDLEEKEAEVQNLIKRFSYFANEAITQICSTIKPKRSFAEFVITEDDVGILKTMPADFISFGDDICLVDGCEAHDVDFTYSGYNKIICKHGGIYHISYNARWITFTNTDDNVILDVPTDILDCLPSYIASQCYKIDDEYKSAVYRNEYEMFLSRIDNTDYKNTKTFLIGGDW